MWTNILYRLVMSWSRESVCSTVWGSPPLGVQKSLRMSQIACEQEASLWIKEQRIINAALLFYWKWKLKGLAQYLVKRPKFVTFGYNNDELFSYFVHYKRLLSSLMNTLCGQLPGSLNGVVRKNETMTCFLSPNTVG